MNYPLISEYIDAIKSAEDNFEELSHLRPVLDTNGIPVMSSGNFAVVFKMKSETDGKLYAVKCFTKEQEGRSKSYKQIAEKLKSVTSDYLIPIKFYEKDLFVDTSQTDNTEFPVLLMDWVEGKTLDKYLRENIHDKYALEMLAYRFSQLASWLIPQPFAHGDLKPDNILVRDNGSLVLVDYDGMFVPTMKGQKARELGSPYFRHPLRTENDFDEHIDDFSFASILLSLKAIAINPQLLDEYGATDRLLLSEKDAQDISQCRLLKDIFPSNEPELNRIVSLFTIALTEKNLSHGSFQLLHLNKPKEPAIEVLSTEVTDKDLAEAWVDEFGAKYSKDRKRLLRGPNCEEYIIRMGTKVIGDKAFYGCWNLEQIIIPDSVTEIGIGAFYHCYYLTNIKIPNSVTRIKARVFEYCENLTHIFIPDSITQIEYLAFHVCSNLTHINIPNSVTHIGNSAFKFCSNLTQINIPNSVIQIGISAFYGCNSLTIIDIPNSIKEIGSSAFAHCQNLSRINIPNSLKRIEDMVFHNLKNLIQINIPNTVTRIEKCAFKGCENLTHITIPDSVTHIGVGAFSDCKKLTQINIPDTVTHIENYAFENCENLTHITIPDSVIHIGIGAFEGCI